MTVILQQMAVNLGEEGFASCGSDGLVVLWKVSGIFLDNEVSKLHSLAKYGLQVAALIQFHLGRKNVVQGLTSNALRTLTAYTHT